MKKPERIDFSDIPEKLICTCSKPCFEDQSTIGLGYVCVYCAKYCDARVIEWKRHAEKLRIARASGF